MSRRRKPPRPKPSKRERDLEATLVILDRELRGTHENLPALREQLRAGHDAVAELLRRSRLARATRIRTDAPAANRATRVTTVVSGGLPTLGKRR